MIKKILTTMLSLSMIAGLAACGTSPQAPASPAGAAEDETQHTHTIGVLVYNRTDEEVLAFRNYLENYIGGCFNVQFLYSDTIVNEDEELAFIQQAADNGVDGIMSFRTADLAAEVSLCEKNEIYYMLASGSVSDEEFDSVSDNPWFLGAVGPGPEVEYQAGVDLANYFVDQAYGDEFTVLSGGGCMNNEMHRQRTMGVLDTLQKRYGVNFEQSSEELAVISEIVHVQAGDLTVCVIPGFIARDEYKIPAMEEYEKDHFPNVLSVLPGSSIREVLKGAHIGVIDAFTDLNQSAVDTGELSYVAGKYGSLIGPSFAAMYNAVTGYAEDFREDGKAFRIEQGFWVSTDKEDYLAKHTLGSSLEINAYNFDDLYGVCKVYNADASLDGLKVLAAAYTYEEVKARRGL